MRSRSFLLGVVLVASMGIFPATARAAVGGGTGNTTTFTNSTAVIRTFQDILVDNNVNTYNTRIVARMQGGPVLFDQSFSAAFDDPAVQAALAAAESTLTESGTVSFLGPTRLSSGHTLSSATQTVETVASDCVAVTTNMYIGPVTILYGALGLCQGIAYEPVSDNGSYGRQIIDNCAGGEWYAVPPGGVDIDTFVLDYQLIDRTITTTNTDLLTEVYELDGVSASGPPPSTSPPSLDLQNGGMGGGWCGMVVGRDGKGPMSASESAGMTALYFALLLLPIGILKLAHRRGKRFPAGKAGIVVLFLAASMLAASSAHAVRLIVPKAQRFHPTTDGQGALTVDTDQTLPPGQLNFGVTESGAKKPLDFGDIHDLKIRKVMVDELYTSDLTAAYGIAPRIELGLDVPYNYLRKGVNATTGIEESDSDFGDVRVNAKFRVVEGARCGLALIPFASFPSGKKEVLLSEGKFGFGVKAAGHLDVAAPLTLYANLGAEHVGNIGTGPDSASYYTPWIQYGVGAEYRLPWRKDRLVAEVNGETAWATPFSHTTLSPVEALAAYRTEVSPGITIQAGGGGGLNKGIGAPQWRAILGIAFRL